MLGVLGQNFLCTDLLGHQIRSFRNLRQSKLFHPITEELNGGQASHDFSLCFGSLWPERLHPIHHLLGVHLFQRTLLDTTVLELSRRSRFLKDFFYLVVGLTQIVGISFLFALRGQVVGHALFHQLHGGCFLSGQKVVCDINQIGQRRELVNTEVEQLQNVFYKASERRLVGASTGNTVQELLEFWVGHAVRQELLGQLKNFVANFASLFVYITSSLYDALQLGRNCSSFKQILVVQLSVNHHCVKFFSEPSNL